MPRLTCSRRVIRALASGCAVYGCWAASAADLFRNWDPSVKWDQPTLAVRAVRPLPDELLRKFTTLVAPRTLAREAYPDLKLLTPRQVVSVLCGSYRQAYWEQLVNLNAEALKVADADKVLGDTAYAIRWPGCPFVAVNPRTKYVVKTGDTAFDVYRTLTGQAGSELAVKNYFSASGIDDLSRLRPGQKLVPSHITAPTTVAASIDAKQFMSAFSYVRSADFAIDAATVKASPWPLDTSIEEPYNPQSQRPTFDVAAGRIESTPTSDKYESPTECTQTPGTGPLFDPVKLTNAYKDAREAVAILHLDNATAKVTIADNGFFGARLQSGLLKFGPQFPKRFFSTAATAGDGQIGPVVRTLNDEPIYPINYSNKQDKASFVSGHGTHVAGLVIGGIDFQPYLSTFDRAPDAPWLKLWIINVGNGKELLLPNSANELSNQINLLFNSIVNLSIQYSSPTATTDSNFLRLLDAPTNNLFVVSAGNNGKSDVTDEPYYPAMLGGVSQRNVISVAAHRADGSLARFTNRGKLNVDLAAPGCDLPSWLDDSGTVSKISGTSQAAAIVTFAATLLKSLGDLSPIEIKNRLMISGDPLRRAAGAAPAGLSEPDPAEIYSRARLNIVRSLYLFDDYVSYQASDGTMREALGALQGITGVRCPDPIEWQNAWALKTSDDGLLLYKGKRSPQEVAHSPCIASATPDAVLQLKVRAFLDAKGVPVTAMPNTIVRVPISSLDQFVSASKPYRKPP
jgi:hypothetical protein